MPPYTTLHNENLIWVFGVGALVTVAIVLARRTRGLTFTLRPRSDEEIARDVHEYADGLSEENRPLPLLVWLVAIGYFVWATGYVLYCAAHGL